MDGATAIVHGALAAGCNFFAGYPITPATPILLAMLREMPKTARPSGRVGIAVQGEDEIASIGMCLGAAAAGLRAMTATSGPGISLYSENIGLAIMAELPLVIVDVQRMGPSTGGATTVGQGDVQFVRWGTAGGYPLVVLAPSTVVECATLTVEAFRLAGRFRSPVVVLTDKELNLTRAVVELSSLPTRNRLPELCSSGSRWLGSGEVARFTGSTHDPEHMITKEAAVVHALNKRLLTKYDAYRPSLTWVQTDLDSGARSTRQSTLLVSYGTAAGAVRAATRLARIEGLCVSSAIVQSLWPVPEASLRAAAAGASRIVVVELNPGLYAREIRCLVPETEVVCLSRVDGQLITPHEIIARCL